MKKDYKRLLEKFCTKHNITIEASMPQVDIMIYDKENTAIGYYRRMNLSKGKTAIVGWQNETD